MSDLFIVEFADGEPFDANGDGSIEVYFSSEDAQDAIDSASEQFDDVVIVRFVRDARIAALEAENARLAKIVETVDETLIANWAWNSTGDYKQMLHDLICFNVQVERQHAHEYHNENNHSNS